MALRPDKFADIIQSFRIFDVEDSGFISLEQLIAVFQKLDLRFSKAAQFNVLLSSGCCAIRYAKIIDWLFDMKLADVTAEEPVQHESAEDGEDLALVDASRKLGHHPQKVDASTEFANLAMKDGQSLSQFVTIATALLEPWQMKIQRLGQCDEADCLLRSRVRPLAEQLQTKLLSNVMPGVIKTCQEDNRYSYFKKLVESDGLQEQMPMKSIDPGASDELLEQYIRWLEVEADHGKNELEQLMLKVKDAINADGSTFEVCQKLRLDSTKAKELASLFDLDLHYRKKAGDDEVIHLVKPSCKSFKRMKDKARQAREWKPTPGSAQQALTDPLRCKLESSDPFVLAFACRIVSEIAKVTRVKNRMLEKSPTQPINVNMNIRLKSGLLTECQFVLVDIAKVQNALHVCYELARAQKPIEAAEVKFGDPPVVLCIGGTGAGKSTLCSAICGREAFVSASSTSSVTQTTQGQKAQWLGRDDEPNVMVVDTPGLADAAGDLKHVYDMVEKLREHACIHTILLVLNSEQCRLTMPQISQLEVFQAVFGEGLWQNLVLGFSRWYMDPASRKRRGGSVEEAQAKTVAKWTAALREKFAGIDNARGSREFSSIFVDAYAIPPKSQATREEADFAERQVQELKDITLRQDPLCTSQISAHLLAKEIEDRLETTISNHANAICESVLSAQSLPVIPETLSIRLQKAKDAFLGIITEEVGETAAQVESLLREGGQKLLLDVGKTIRAGCALVNRRKKQAEDMQICQQKFRKHCSKLLPSIKNLCNVQGNLCHLKWAIKASREEECDMVTQIAAQTYLQGVDDHIAKCLKEVTVGSEASVQGVAIRDLLLHMTRRWLQAKEAYARREEAHDRSRMPLDIKEKIRFLIGCVDRVMPTKFNAVLRQVAERLVAEQQVQQSLSVIEAIDDAVMLVSHFREAAGGAAVELKDVGFTAGELASAGFAAEEIEGVGFTAEELKACAAGELKCAGFTAGEIRDAGFKAKQLEVAGFSAKELTGAGFSFKALWCMFDEGELMRAGWTQDEIEDESDNCFIGGCPHSGYNDSWRYICDDCGEKYREGSPPSDLDTDDPSGVPNGLRMR